jgi:hypothetical protein
MTDRKIEREMIAQDHQYHEVEEARIAEIESQQVAEVEDIYA